MTKSAVAVLRGPFQLVESNGCGARIFRDAKLTEIGEGTSEIQRLVIAREIRQLG